MIRKFLRDRGGNYAMLTAFAMLPIMGSVAVAVDYSEMNRQKQATVQGMGDSSGAGEARHARGSGTSRHWGEPRDRTPGSAATRLDGAPGAVGRSLA